MEGIAQEFNNFYNFTSDHSEVKDESPLKKWKYTTPAELYSFLAANLLIPLDKKINDVWSMDPYISTPIFKKIMSRDSAKNAVFLRQQEYKQRRQTFQIEIDHQSHEDDISEIILPIRESVH